MTDASQQITPWHKLALYNLTNLALFLAGATNLFIGTISALDNRTTIAATSLTAGLVLLFAATIDRFESLKGLGVEAKTRQLDSKLVQADDALRQLRVFAELAGTALIELNSKIGRWDSAPTSSEAYNLAQKTKSIMTALGSGSTEIRKALDPWVRVTCFDMAWTVLLPLRTALLEKIRELEQARAAIPQPINAANAPVIARLAAEIQLGHDFLGARINNANNFETIDFPQRFLHLFEEVPLLGNDVVEPLRQVARQLSPEMLTFREKLELPDPEKWFSKIDKKDEQS